MSARATLATAFALAVAGCWGGEGEVYALPADQVRAKLLATKLPFPLNGTEHASMTTRAMDDGAIELALADAAGRAQLRFLAKVAEEGAGKTRVVLSFAGAGSSFAQADKGMAEHPEIKAVYLKVVREQVDSELENGRSTIWKSAPRSSRPLPSMRARSSRT